LRNPRHVHPGEELTIGYLEHFIAGVPALMTMLRTCLPQPRHEHLQDHLVRGRLDRIVTSYQK